MKKLMFLVLLALIIGCEKEEAPLDVSGTWEVIVGSDTSYFELVQSPQNVVTGFVTQELGGDVALRFSTGSCVRADSIFLNVRIEDITYQYRGKASKNCMNGGIFWTYGSLGWIYFIDWKAKRTQVVE